MNEYKKEIESHIKSGKRKLSNAWWDFAGKHSKAIVITEFVVWLTLAGIMLYLAYTVLGPLVVK